MEQVCVIGCGYVGEQLIRVFSKHYKVIGYDISDERILELRHRFRDNININIQNTTDNLSISKLFCICVPTLLTDNGVDISNIHKAIELLENVAMEYSAIVMESTVHVGLTRQLLGKFRDRNIFIGFSPERVDPGRITPTIDQIPKIVSGYDSKSLEAIAVYYNNIFDIIPVSSIELAEMSKLTENCFRMINIAYINEISDICQKWGIDPYELVNTCATKPYGYMPFYPGLGVGGYCIPVNPDWLGVNNHIPLLKYATELTKNRPINKAKELIRNITKVSSKILVVGLAFKPGQKLTVNSPGIAYATELMNNGISVTVYDPLVDINDRNIMPFQQLTSEQWNLDILNGYDIICIAMKQYQIDYSILDNCTARIIKYCY